MSRVVVDAISHQVHLAPIGVSVLFPSEVRNTDAIAVQGADPTSVLIRTGIASGPVTFSFTTGPPTDEQDRLADHGWEVTRLTIPVEAPLLLCAPSGEQAYEVFEPDAPGPHHVLVAGKGRESHRDLAVFVPDEEYLLLVWPAGR